MIGIASGVAAVLFGMGIAWIQTLAYGTPDGDRLHSFAETLDWYWVVLIPTIGGVATGLLFHYLTDDGRVRSVADVIEGAALHDGRVRRGRGIGLGRGKFDHPVHRWVHRTRGPAVHIAAMISSKGLWSRVNARGITARDFVGMRHRCCGCSRFQCTYCWRAFRNLR